MRKSIKITSSKNKFFKKLDNITIGTNTLMIIIFSLLLNFITYFQNSTHSTKMFELYFSKEYSQYPLYSLNSLFKGNNYEMSLRAENYITLLLAFSIIKILFSELFYLISCFVFDLVLYFFLKKK
jgi:hypothetical protein